MGEIDIIMKMKILSATGFILLLVSCISGYTQKPVFSQQEKIRLYYEKLLQEDSKENFPGMEEENRVFLETLLKYGQKGEILSRDEINSFMEFSGDTETVVLDSILGFKVADNDSVLTYRQIFYYDLDNRLISKVAKQFNIHEQKWENSEKYEYEYDAEGRMTRQKKSVWDEDISSWRTDNDVIYAYDEAGREILLERYVWDNFESRLEGFYRWAWEFNENGQTKSFSDYSWDDENGQWIPRFRRDYIYTDTSDVSLMYNWSSDNQQWKESMKIEHVHGKFKNEYVYETSLADWYWTKHEQYFYNETGDTLLESLTVIRSWPDTAWQKWEHFVRVYDGLMRTDTVYVWSKPDSVWMYSKVNQYVYDDEGRCLSEKYYGWDESTSSWQIYFGCEKTYNEAGLRTSYTGWGSSKLFTWKYEYDDKNRLTAKELFDWSYGVNIPRKRTEYGYNDADKIIFKIEYSWDGEMEAWHMDTKYWYFYGPFSGIKDLKKLGWKVYPNPASDHLLIEPEGNVTVALKVVFINLNGQAVKEVVLDHASLQEVIPVGDLKQGYYLVRLYSGGELLGTHKIVIRR